MTSVINPKFERPHEPTELGDAMVSALTSLGVLRKPRKGGRK